MKNAARFAIGCLVYLALVLLCPAQQAAPGEILAKSQEAYRSLQTLHCQEMIRTQMNTKGRDFTVETSATIMLGRPELFLITWSQAMPKMPFPMPGQGGAVWSGAEGPLLYMGVNNSYSPATSMVMALAAATGISGGAAHNLPALFFAQKELGVILTSMTTPKIIGTATIEGEDCDIVAGQGAVSFDTLWVSKKNALILKSESVMDSRRQTFPKKMTDKEIDEALKAMNKEVTPENRDDMKKMMEHAQTAFRDIQTTTTNTYHYIAINGKMDKKDFEYPLPPGAVRQESLFGFGGKTGLKDAEKARDALKSAPTPEEAERLERQTQAKVEALKKQARGLDEQLDRELKAGAGKKKQE